MTLNINSKTLFLTYSQVNQDGIDRFVSTPSDHFDFVSSSLGTPTDTDLHANHTKMGDIIFTLTSVSRALCAFDRPPGSTLDSIIQISSRFEQAIVELGTTSERMVTSSTRSATRLIQLVDRVGAAATLYGLRLYAQNLKKNFIRSCETELRDIISYITDNSNNTPRSSMEFVHNHTNRQPLRTLLTENCRMEEPGDYRRQRRRTQTEKSNPLGSDEDW